MKIDKSQVKISFTFTPEQYFLCKSDDEMLGEYSLNYRIDRSEKSKDDDIGMPRIYLDKAEAEICRHNGFIEVR